MAKKRQPKKSAAKPRKHHRDPFAQDAAADYPDPFATDPQTVCSRDPFAPNPRAAQLPDPFAQDAGTDYPDPFAIDPRAPQLPDPFAQDAADYPDPFAPARWSRGQAESRARNAQKRPQLPVLLDAKGQQIAIGDAVTFYGRDVRPFKMRVVDMETIDTTGYMLSVTLWVFEPEAVRGEESYSMPALVTDNPRVWKAGDLIRIGSPKDFLGGIGSAVPMLNLAQKTGVFSSPASAVTLLGELVRTVPLNEAEKTAARNRIRAYDHHGIQSPHILEMAKESASETCCSYRDGNLGQAREKLVCCMGNLAAIYGLHGIDSADFAEGDDAEESDDEMPVGAIAGDSDDDFDDDGE